MPDETAIGVGDAHARGQFALEGVHFRAHDEALAVAHARDRREDLLADGPVLRRQVEQRHGQIWRGGGRGGTD